MADRSDNDDALAELLAGWGTPPAKPEFVDRVLAHIDRDGSAQRRRRRWGLASTFALGGVVGGLAVAAVLQGGSAPPPPSSARPIHLQAPLVADVVGEPGSQLQWERREDGRFVLEVVGGIAWVRHASAAHELTVLADGEEVVLRGDCGRVEVTRTLLSIDTNFDDVDCDELDAIVERARAELSGPSSR